MPLKRLSIERSALMVSHTSLQRGELVEQNLIEMENRSHALPTDEELTRIYKEANNELEKPQPITTQRIFRAMRAAILRDRAAHK